MPADTLRTLNARLSALGDELDAALASGLATTPDGDDVSVLVERYEALAREQSAALTAHLEAQRAELAAIETQARRIRSHLDGTAPAAPTQPAPSPRARLDAAAQAWRSASTDTERDAAYSARAEALSEILSQHAAWRSDPATGARAYLADAYLADAYLAGADLADANLAGADLAGANLAGADLARANLARANLADAYLAGADLADAYLARANLADANLADAYLAGADLIEPYQRQSPTPEVLAARAQRYRERHPDVPVVERLDSRILDAVTAGGGTLDMGAWHTCETTHCRAGWAIHLAGAPGYALERIHGPAVAGRMIYRASTGRSPHFYAPTDRALEDIRRCASEAVPS